MPQELGDCEHFSYLPARSMLGLLEHKFEMWDTNLLTTCIKVIHQKDFRSIQLPDREQEIVSPYTTISSTPKILPTHNVQPWRSTKQNVGSKAVDCRDWDNACWRKVRSKTSYETKTNSLPIMQTGKGTIFDLVLFVACVRKAGLA